MMLLSRFTKNKDTAMGFMTGKRILITGVASKLSIAYGIAKAMRPRCRTCIFTKMKNLKPRVEEFAASLDSNIVLGVMCQKTKASILCMQNLQKFGQNMMVLFTLSVLLLLTN